MGRRRAVIRKAMVAEGNETQSKQNAQYVYTKEDIKLLEDYMRHRFGMTPTAVSSVWRQYGTAQIGRMTQEVYEEDVATALQNKAETPAEVLIKQHAIDRANIANAQQERLPALSAQWWQAPTQEEEMAINERKQIKQSEETSTTRELKQSEERRKAVHEEAIATALETKAATQPEAELTTKKQQQTSEATTKKEQQKHEEELILKNPQQKQRSSKSMRKN